LERLSAQHACSQSRYAPEAAREFIRCHNPFYSSAEAADLRRASAVR
jgi:hypothetical protein